MGACQEKTRITLPKRLSETSQPTIFPSIHLFIYLAIHSSSQRAGSQCLKPKSPKWRLKCLERFNLTNFWLQLMSLRCHTIIRAIGQHFYYLPSFIFLFYSVIIIAKTVHHFLFIYNNNNNKSNLET